LPTTEDPVESKYPSTDLATPNPVISFDMASGFATPGRLTASSTPTLRRVIAR
jgi:hypothetical protein